MTAKEYLKQAYLLDKQIQVEVKELEQLRERYNSGMFLWRKDWYQSE